MEPQSEKPVDEKIEFAFKVQGVSTTQLIEILNRVTAENLRFLPYELPQAPGQINPFGRKAIKADSQYLGSVYILTEGAWNDYQYMKEVKKRKNKLSLKHAVGLTNGMPVQDELIAGAAIAVVGGIVFGLYYIGLALAGLIANIFTLGAHKVRKEKYVIVVEASKEKEDQVTKLSSDIVTEIIRNGGYAQSLTKVDVKLNEETLKVNQQLIKYYTKYFNMGKTIVTIALMFLILLEGIKLIQEFYFGFSTIMQGQAWLYWRYPLLGLSLVGLFILIYGNSNINKVSKKIKSTIFP